METDHLNKETYRELSLPEKIQTFRREEMSDDMLLSDGAVVLDKLLPQEVTSVKELRDTALAETTQEKFALNREQWWHIFKRAQYLQRADDRPTVPQNNGRKEPIPADVFVEIEAIAREKLEIKLS